MANINLFYAQSGSSLQQKAVKHSSSLYKKNVLRLIFLLSVFKCILAFVLELGNDEAYYWLYSQYLQWNYFDHPPMVAIWIRLFTFNLALDHYEGFVRLGSIVGSAAATWFMYKTVAAIHTEKSGWFAAILYNASFYAGITAGLYILPDSPQMVFWTFCLWMIARIAKDEKNWSNWILFGISAGLCIMSKVHGGFLWIGLGTWILIRKREWLAKPQLYIATLLTAIIISPIFFWNIKYNFITWQYHSQRVDVDEFIIKWFSFLKQLFSQLGFNNPVNVGLIIWALIAWCKGKVKSNALSIYNFIGLPLALMLLVVSFFRDTTLPHWSGPAFVSLIPLAAIRLAQVNSNFFPKILKWALGVFLMVYIAWAAAVQYYPGTYSTDKENLGRGDVTVDMYGWREASEQFIVFYKNDIANNIMPAGSPMVTTHWWGAHVEYYFASPLHLKMIGLGEAGLGHYLWTNAKRRDNVDLDNVYCIVPSGDRYRVPFSYFEKAELVQVLDIDRNGRPAHRFYVYRLRGLKKEVPVIK